MLAGDEMRTAPRRCDGEKGNYCSLFAQTIRSAPVLLLAVVAISVKQGRVLDYGNPHYPQHLSGEFGDKTSPEGCRTQRRRSSCFSDDCDDRERCMLRTLAFRSRDAKHRYLTDSVVWCASYLTVTAPAGARLSAPPDRGASCPSDADERCSSSERAPKQCRPMLATPTSIR